MTASPSTRGFIRRLGSEDAGQATVEYIVLLAVVTVLALFLGKALRPIIRKIIDSSTGYIDRLFSKGDLHRAPFR